MVIPKCQDVLRFLIVSQGEISMLPPKGSGRGPRYRPAKPRFLMAADVREHFDCHPGTASSKLSQLFRGGKVERKRILRGPGGGSGRSSYAYIPSHWGIKWAIRQEIVRPSRKKAAKAGGKAVRVAANPERSRKGGTS